MLTRVADVVAHLVRLLPPLSELVLGALYAECPVAAPIYLLREKTESDEVCVCGVCCVMCDGT
jgi:hypothetical protein